MKLSTLEESFALQLRASKIPFEREVRGLIPGRKFKVDFFILDFLVVESNGAIWVKGGHSSGAGITRDYEKCAELLLQGYPVINVTADQINSGQALSWVEQALLIYKKFEVQK